MCYAEIKYQCSVSLAVKWGWLGWVHVLVQWVEFSSVCKLPGRAGLGEEKVTHIYLCLQQL